ncbi:MAG: glycosyltransferase family 4 protein [Calditrichaceae bacterium]
MKIAMILDQEFPPDNRVENEAISLINAGHEVHLFCLDFDNKASFELINNINVYRYKFSKLLHEKLSPLAYTVPFYHQLLRKKLQQFFKTVSIDVIHVHDMVAIEPILKLWKNDTIPIILDLHENRPEIMKLYSHVRSFPGNILINLDKWVEKQFFFIERVDKIIVVTAEAKKDILKKSKKRKNDIYVVPNSVRLNKFLSYPVYSDITKKYEYNFVILYLGSTGVRRGLESAIKSINLLKHKIKNIKLVIVGNSRDDNYLKTLTADLHLEKQIDLVGWKDMKLFPSYIKASNVCISPLLKNRHHETTYANKLFQYMAFSKPIIVSNCEAQANLIEELGCGLIHEPSNEVDLADKIYHLYQNPDIAVQMGKNSFDAIKSEYRWEKIEKNLIKVYQDVKSKG